MRSGLYNATQDKPITSSLEHARSFLARAKGLLFRTGITVDHGLVLYQTNSIHMFFMLFTIDVVFLDEDKQVVALFPRRRPFSFPVWAKKAEICVELHPGVIESSGVKIGDRLELWD